MCANNNIIFSSLFVSIQIHVQIRLFFVMLDGHLTSLFVVLQGDE